MVTGSVPRIEKQRSPGERRSRLRRLVEYYFSDANLSKDVNLYMKIMSSPEGWIPVEDLLVFPLVQARRARIGEITELAPWSKKLEFGVQSGKWVIRRRDCPPLPAFVDHAWGRCNNFHFLQRIVARNERTCNLCCRSIHCAEVVQQCASCDYDKCEACHQQQRLKKLLESQQGQTKPKATCEALANFWKADAIPGKFRKIPAPATIEHVRYAFRHLSHQDQFVNFVQSRCWAFQQMTIISVERIHHPHLWKKYNMARDDMKKEHSELGVTAKPVDCEATKFLESLTDRGPLDVELNEVMLVHGCKAKAAKAIVKEGFDIRHSKSNGGSLYGEGIYFARQPCKSA